MPNIVEFKVEGITQSIDNLEDYSDRVQENLLEILDFYAFSIQRQAQINAPVDTGYLRSSIIVIDREKWSRVIASTAEYGGFVEFGTVRTPAQPYLTPAFLQFKKAFAADIQKALE